MIYRVGLAILGVLALGNAIAMIAFPRLWYGTTPGVTMTGPYNAHFIADIGLAFAASGAGLLAGFRPGATAATLALAGATWPALHALFHVWLWFVRGFPTAPTMIATETIGVVGISALGVGLAIARARQDGVV